MKKTLVFLILVLIVVAFLPPAKAGNGEVTLAELKKDIAYLIKLLTALKRLRTANQSPELCQPQQPSAVIADRNKESGNRKDMEGTGR